MAHVWPAGYLPVYLPVFVVLPFLFHIFRSDWISREKAALIKFLGKNWTLYPRSIWVMSLEKGANI